MKTSIQVILIALLAFIGTISANAIGYHSPTDRTRVYAGMNKRLRHHILKGHHKWHRDVCRKCHLTKQEVRKMEPQVKKLEQEMNQREYKRYEAKAEKYEVRANKHKARTIRHKAHRMEKYAERTERQKGKVERKKNKGKRHKARKAKEQ